MDPGLSDARPRAGAAPCGPHPEEERRRAPPGERGREEGGGEPPGDFSRQGRSAPRRKLARCTGAAGPSTLYDAALPTEFRAALKTVGHGCIVLALDPLRSGGAADDPTGDGECIRSSCLRVVMLYD